MFARLYGGHCPACFWLCSYGEQPHALPEDVVRNDEGRSSETEAPLVV